MVYKDPHDDEYYKKKILKHLAKKECVRKQMYRALGAKIKAEQLTRVLESLQAENKISCRTLQYSNYPKAWGLIDHPEQVKERESRERYQRMWEAQQEKYRAAGREKQAREDWHECLTQFMVANGPDDVNELLLDVLRRLKRWNHGWLHSSPDLSIVRVEPYPSPLRRDWRINVSDRCRTMTFPSKLADKN